MAGLLYNVNKTKLEKAMMKGMSCEGSSIISDLQEGIHYFFLPAIDSGVSDRQWGRLSCQMHIPENCVCYLYAAASNEKDGESYLLDADVSLTEKKRYLSSIKCLRFINKPDVLLYEIEGRYLWIAVEIIGDDASISNIQIQIPGDNFMQVFPGIYRERNSFLHRYLSIYSSIYNDFQDKIDHLEYLFDIDKAPKKLLELYLKWMGIDVDGGFLDEKVLRELLRESGELIRCKGTRKSIERICELFIGKKPIILERGLMQPYVRTDQQKIYDNLYGDSPYDVTLLIEGDVKEHRREQLLHLLRQFKQVRIKLHIVFLNNSGELDSHSYLDVNALVFSHEEGNLDVTTLIDGSSVLI